MSISVKGGGTPDMVHLLTMRKQMSAEKEQSAQLLQMLTPPQPVAPPPTQQRTFYL